MSSPARRVTSSSANTSLQTLLEETLVSLRERKLEINNLIRLFESERDEKGESRFKPWLNRQEFETDFAKALEEKRFVLQYQPNVSLRSRELVGFEALVRWNHSRRGIIKPGEFIWLAEKTGLIVPLGNWVLEQACWQMSTWRRELPLAANLSVSVNLSSRQLIEESLVAHVQRCLKRHNLAPEALHLELTETSVMENPELASRIMEQLRKLRVKVWIDDFGTGHSSLGYLNRFPFSALKIDRSFVAQMAKKDTLSITRAILVLSRELGLNVVAEGIETAEQAEELERLGCGCGQGYFFSGPLDPTAAARFIVGRDRPESAREKALAAAR